VITVCNLVKHYERKEALRGVSFTIRPGEITAYLGPNGAGKSTTVKMIAGHPRDLEVIGHRAGLSADRRRRGSRPGLGWHRGV
jgi:ABC-2 type transport system ATP-binding protein